MTEPIRAELAGGVPAWILHRPGAGVTTVTLWTLTGSRYEDEDLSGGTHLLEHILMQAPLPGGGRPVDLLEALGGEANAVTSRDHLVLYARVPTSETLAALDVLSRALAEPVITAEVLEAERRVVQEELRLAASDPADVVHDLFFDAAFPGGALGRPVGGTAGSVGRLGLEALRAHHARWARAGTVAAVICGGADPDALLRALETGPLGALPPAGPLPVPERPRFGGGGRRTLALNSDSAGVVLGGPAVPYGDRLLPAWQVLMDLVADASSALLTEEIRNRRGLSYEMWGFANAYRDAGVWRAFVSTAPENVGEVVETAVALLEERAGLGWTGEEVALAARRTAGLFRLEAEESLEEALLYGRYGLLGGDPQWTLDAQVAAIRAVTSDDVLAALRAAVDPLVIAIAGID
ncbi:M16 family metallopeptidase [Streptosporangium sandarakinum]|uniref:M16 family metallopeptidase n=1 Tax=Streptosporangium sandarakinum TaxID=1260955 RepID=UPI0037AB2BA9